jgi:NlpC/P60 family putative phage cell wall peptidase
MRFQTDERRLAVIEEAKTWVGTPFRHQARVKGVGVDCAQLVIAVGESCGLLAVDPAAWRRFAGYGRAPNPKRMEEALRSFMVPIPPSRARLGDVAWLEWRRELPMHLAILSRHGERATLIHALSEVGKACEHGFVAEWPERVVSWWRYPGLAAPGALRPAEV